MNILIKKSYILIFISVLLVNISVASSEQAGEKDNVLLAIVIGKKSMFLEEFFQKIQHLDYPKNHIHVYVTVQNVTKMDFVKASVKQWSKLGYRSTTVFAREDPVKIKLETIQRAQTLKTKYIFFVSSVVQLERSDTLDVLVEQDKTIVSPFLKTYEKFGFARRICDVGLEKPLNDTHSFPKLVTQGGLRDYNYPKILIGTNFVTEDVLTRRGVDARNDKAYWISIPDLKKEREGKEKGELEAINDRSKCCVQAVEAVRHCMLVKTDLFQTDPGRFFEDNSIKNKDSNSPNVVDDLALLDSVFSEAVKAAGQEMFLVNTNTYGQLINLFNFPEKKFHPELTRILENHDLWERRYIIDEVRKTFTTDPEIMPEVLPIETVSNGSCRDTYKMVMFTDTFCDEWIEEAEWENNWFASGNHEIYDDRNKRKEAVPTTDINLWQYGLEEAWMAFINYYIYPRKCTFYPGHPGYDLGGHFFTVRYRWEEQPALKPHNDNSLFSLNVALNQMDQDFTGGGTKFLRLNCSELDLPKGSILAHPGRVTHFHEGLATTSGTRYILVSFVDSVYPCFERFGVPMCPGYMRLPNFEEVKKKYDFVARVNEGMNQRIEIIKN